MSILLLVALCFVGVSVTAQSMWSPARYQSGTVPALPAVAVAGGEVMLEVDVACNGRVAAVAPLRATPPFTDAVVAAVRGWRFDPAVDTVPSEPGCEDQAGPVASKVLVAAVFRAPVLIGPTAGHPPADLQAASEETAFPQAMTIPLYPPSAHSSGVVLLEVRVDAGGKVTEANAIRSAPPFDDPALKAVRQWRFRPARLHGTPVITFAYVLFGFPAPVGTSEPRRN